MCYTKIISGWVYRKLVEGNDMERRRQLRLGNGVTADATVTLVKPTVTNAYRMDGQVNDYGLPPYGIGTSCTTTDFSPSETIPDNA